MDRQRRKTIVTTQNLRKEYISFEEELIIKGRKELGVPMHSGSKQTFKTKKRTDSIPPNQDN